MIEKHQTVLILGAGASVPFGFPSGRELVQLVCQELNSQSIIYKARMQLLGDMGISQQEITAFRENLLGSQQPSVDAFLEYRPEFEKVGKAAMAMILLPAEDASKSRLFPEGTQHWYENNSKFGNLPGPTAMGCPGGMLGDGPKIGRNRGIMAAPGRPWKQAIRGRLA